MSFICLRAISRSSSILSIRSRPPILSKQILATLSNRTISKMTKLTYPTVRRDTEFVEKIHGVDIPDPYRWLEDENAEEVKQFAVEQQKFAMSYIEQAPNRKQIREKLTELWNYPKFGCPFKRGDAYYMSKNSGLQNQNVIYTFKSLDGEHEVFLDPNTFSADGTSSLSILSFSKDGKWAAYAISVAGSDWLTIRVRNVETKQDLPDQLEHAKFTHIGWTHDHLGFFYSRYEKQGNVLTESVANEHHKVYYHRLNTPQSDDVLIFDLPDKPKKLLIGEVSDCGKYLFLTVSEKCRENACYFAKLDENVPIQKRFEVYPIITEEKFEYEYITNDGELAYFKTNNKAPNNRVIRVDLNNPAESNWVDIIPEDPQAVLDAAKCVDDDKLAIVYMRDVIDQVEIRSLASGELLKKIELPIGTVGISGKRSQSELFFSITSFLSPGTIFYLDLKGSEQQPKTFIETKLKDFNPADYVTKQVFYTAKDGTTKIPMFIVHGKDLKLDGNNPAHLIGYGGFSISYQPFFSIHRLLFMKQFAGVFALANIRGGGEYGLKWYDAGRLLNKQNVFDDFIRAGEYLVENGYTSKEKLAIQGGSNGGLLVAACANQRPDLFGAVIGQVGVMDLLRYDKFTIGSAWRSDYGDRDGEDGEAHFRNQLKLSPLHNVPKNDIQKFPATLLLTADHDNRVVPLHSFKLAAELQHTLGNKVSDPLLLRVDLNAGHGAGKSTERIIEEYVDIYSFLQKALNLKYYE